MSIRDKVAATITALDNEHEARKRLPIDARNVIMNAYNVVIDIQSDDMDIEAANTALGDACDAINAYVNNAAMSQADEREIGRIVRPFTELSHALNYAEAYGED